MANHVFIDCTVAPGMFGSEYGVEVDTVAGEKVSFFVDRATITPNGSPQTGFLRVSQFSRKGGVARVLLPCEAFETGSRWVDVSTKLLHTHIA
jgi:hypothetical protein